MLNPGISLVDQTVVITGASRGIGAATARRFAAAGANVVLLARSVDALASMADEIGRHALPIACDVADWDSVLAAFTQAKRQLGCIDILVNNAAQIEPIAHLHDVSVAAWDQLIDVNLKGVFHGIRAALPLMKAQGQGTIINVSSGAAISPLEAWSAYCASKAAVLMLTRCVHQEQAQHGIRCVGLSPGTVATGLQHTIKATGINPVSKLDWSDHIPPEWAAEAILWLTTNEAAAHDGSDFSLKTDAGRAAVGLPLG